MKELKEKLISFLRIENVRVFLYFCLAGLLAHLDRFILRSYALFKVHDTFDLFWPYQVVMAKRILSGQMLGWLPDYVGGLPIFYMDFNWLSPSVILSGVFNGFWGFVAVTMMQFLLAGFGGYLFLKHFFGTDKYASFFGGLLWALGAFTLTYSSRSMDLVAIPLIFYCTDRLAFAEGRKTRLLLLLGLFLSATNVYFAKGAPFIAFFQLLFIFFSNPEWSKRKKVLLTYVMVWISVVIINLPVIVSLLSSMKVGHRSLAHWIPEGGKSLGQRLYYILINPVAISESVLGFVGSLVLFYGFFSFKKWPKLLRFMLYFYAVGLFYNAFIDQAIWYQTLRSYLPFAEYRLSRFVLPVPFILVMIAGVNFKNFLEFLQVNFKRIFIFATAVFFVLIYFIMDNYYFPLNANHLVACIFSFVVFVAGIYLLKKRNAKQLWIIYFILSLLFAEKFIVINLVRLGAIHPPSFKHFFQSELYDKFRPNNKYDYRISYVNWHPSAGLYNNYQVAGGYASQYLRRYAIFWETLITGEEEKEEFAGYPYKAYLFNHYSKREEIPPKTIKNLTFNTDLLALHNVRYLFFLNKVERPERWDLSLVQEGGWVYSGSMPKTELERKWLLFLDRPRRVTTSIQYYVYELEKYQPRMFVPNSFLLVNNENMLKEHLSSSSVYKLKNRVVYNREDLTAAQIKELSSLPYPKTKAKPEITYYSDNKIVISAKAQQRQQLILMENYMHEWTATINGKPISILPAYGTFRAVILEKGENEIVFEYRPAYLVVSIWISGIGFVSFVLLGIFWSLKGTGKEDNK